MSKPRMLTVICVTLLLALCSSGAAHAAPAAAYAAPVNVPILMYHHIGGVSANTVGARYYVAPDVFDRQMAYLARNGYTPVTIDQVAAALQGGRPLPARPVAITFDDGNLDAYTAALPILEKYRLSATFLIVTRWVGTPNHLTWPEIQTMQRDGMHFGSHTLNHLYLSKVPLGTARHEIVDSKTELQQRIGAPVTVFAYPGGFQSPQVRSIVASAGYLAALGTSPLRIQHSVGELYNLTRCGVYRFTSFPVFTHWLDHEPHA